MLNNDYNKQYARRQRIKKTTLVMGIDIGSDFNAVGFMNKDGSGLIRCITHGKGSISSYE